MKASNLLMGAALAGLALAGAGNLTAKNAKKKVAMGECHGINACKGQGQCGTKKHACAGMNACKGQGWIKMTAADCKAKKGRFQAMTMEM